MKHIKKNVIFGICLVIFFVSVFCGDKIPFFNETLLGIWMMITVYFELIKNPKVSDQANIPDNSKRSFLCPWKTYSWSFYPRRRFFILQCHWQTRPIILFVNDPSWLVYFPQFLQKVRIQRSFY